MKIIKTILLLAITIFVSTVIFAQQAQEVKTEIAKPIASTLPVSGPDTKPNPDLTGSAKPQQQPLLKESTDKPVAADEKNEKIKPQQAPSQNIIPTPVIIADTRQSAVNRAPVIPSPNSNTAPTAPVKPAQKTAVLQQQQN
ncbi:MAG: hypothetical protein ABIO79_08480 [Ferruginibacter sp.]